jgi:3-methyladenine DNA glycosylase/8-oxoguanine DNA glycosylase
VSDPTFLPADGLDLALTAAPVAWGRGRWPTCDVIDGALVSVDRAGETVRVVVVRQPAPDRLDITGLPADAAADWARAHLGWGRVMTTFADPLLAGLAQAMPGLRPWSLGGLGRGALASIIGQSISVQAAATVEGRVCALFHPGIDVAGRRFWPFPDPGQLADATPASLREAGLTWRKAEALVAGGRLIAEGALLADAAALVDPAAAAQALRSLPLVGPWTAASAMLWGLGADDAHPTGDVALLRALKQATGEGDITLRELDARAEAWRPGRAWAARLLWTRLLGPAWANENGR